eukprot:CAMPEP_0194269968 /NCGR_PEP_ID=MMETSP0169-20130528/4049_1 /TAXON_ID=218684 /ORGANISM="Corethron pennatum, Strain L29A3" /LENGTH=959 /DNA_ID=CAMNT_0039011833 /DNA_START=49 /DNA_END=2928 /DNA_ORIENTATION=+
MATEKVNEIGYEPAAIEESCDEDSEEEENFKVAETNSSLPALVRSPVVMLASVGIVVALAIQHAPFLQNVSEMKHLDDVVMRQRSRDGMDGFIRNGSGAVRGKNGQRGHVVGDGTEGAGGAGGIHANVGGSVGKESEGGDGGSLLKGPNMFDVPGDQQDLGRSVPTPTYGNPGAPSMQRQTDQIEEYSRKTGIPTAILVEKLKNDHQVFEKQRDFWVSLFQHKGRNVSPSSGYDGGTIKLWKVYEQDGGLFDLKKYYVTELARKDYSKDELFEPAMPPADDDDDDEIHMPANDDDEIRAPAEDDDDEPVSSPNEDEDRNDSKVCAQKTVDEEVEAKRLENQKVEAKRQMENRKLEFERLEAERLEGKRMERIIMEEELEAKQLENQKVEARRLMEIRKLEAKRLERVEAERLEAERLEAERLEIERLEVEQLLEMERLEAERLEVEQLEAEQIQERLANEVEKDAVVRGTIEMLVIPQSMSVGRTLVNRIIPESVPVYISPPADTFYLKRDGSGVDKGTVITRSGDAIMEEAKTNELATGKVMKFNGFQGKFINMTPDTIQLYWFGNGQSYPMAIIPGWESSGTATFPGHHFFVGLRGNSNVKDAFEHYHMEGHEQVRWYDPISKDLALYSKLSKENKELYDLHKANKDFSKLYLERTGRHWLSFFPRKPPGHFMHKADYIGQVHHVVTKQTHFVQSPPKDFMSKLTREKYDEMKESKSEVSLKDYRDPEPILNLTMKVLSCEPRAFEIIDFLSEAEIAHFFDVVQEQELHASTVSGDSDNSGEVPKTKTRTSRNTWIYRETDPIMDAIYRRAADLLKIDELKMRRRIKGEYDELETKNPIVEALQLVHYAPGQEYTAHHDFGYARVRSLEQGARFSTILLYLNGPSDGLRGGFTTFPRWKNLETRNALKVTPLPGKAVLFYSHLEDGNMDDLSQHSAAPIVAGEKWLANLWTWEPNHD